ncbi:hypothetical protein EW146_g1600 [Bondarzewia mesenterica]|uniref:G-alpha-domain-containing protein n=1 Tax=Bondarzewia mesenterica TaxID=1095465 RepID=A0A4S4M4U6_9AGAM|nr:hypothetical protein EW146_g1600 [Bondarzewia mesenterica]
MSFRRDRITHNSGQSQTSSRSQLSETLSRPVGEEEISPWPPVPTTPETEEERILRLENEKEANRINDEIDIALEAERQERKRRKVHVKIILLGQAESGKSTMLRNFQLQFTPQAFRKEAEAWRAVIHLNLVRSVTFILNLLSDTRTSVPPPSPASQLGIAEPDSDTADQTKPTVRTTGELRHLRIRLSPLRSVEEALANFLSAEAVHPQQQQELSLYDRAFEVSVRPGSKWKSLFRTNLAAASGSGGNGRPTRHRAQDELANAKKVIEACREDMIALWENETVRESLRSQRVALEFQSGFFLDEVDRIAAPGYEPLPGDILKARIQTMGVEEHLLTMETVNVLLFLAPVSAFNQVLAEDPFVNRLWDSFFLWKTICASRLLRDVTFVLLLNKHDILKAKLQSGVKFRKFVTSYRDKPNEPEDVLAYIKSKFTLIYKQHSPVGRLLRVHVTCATVAIIFPPAAAAFITGCSCDLLINVCLTILGYLPGHLHAFWLIYKKMKAEDAYGRGGYISDSPFSVCVFVDIGNGQYEAAFPSAQGGLAQEAPVPYYGATTN